MSDDLKYERAYFERGFIAAAAWALTKRPGVTLSDAVIDHAWAHRDEGMDDGDILPIAAFDHPATVEGEVTPKLVPVTQSDRATLLEIVEYWKIGFEQEALGAVTRHRLAHSAPKDAPTD